MPRYFISVLIYFWVPVLVMAPFLLPHQDRLTRKIVWLTLGVFAILASVNEYIYLHFDLWTFSELKDPLLGPRLFGAPIEEFWFWFGAIPFTICLYLFFDLILEPKPLPPLRLPRVPRIARPGRPRAAEPAGAKILVHLQ